MECTQQVIRHRVNYILHSFTLTTIISSTSNITNNNSIRIDVYPL
nr:MAG TPA: hypothetical protein [Caudoviricetes sp.]DAR21066.1 MAG TPA: hypothetical protein [Caudoviricetes sp.]DAW93959.1 MAG TPA: hypothetical protein [Caudoviricetes sp.]